MERKRINEEDEQDILDFVSQPDPKQRKKNYNYFNYEEVDWEVPNFGNLELDEEKHKPMKKE